MRFSEFLKPVVEQMQYSIVECEGAEYVDLNGTDCEGWIAYLSADGFMDRTEPTECETERDGWIYVLRVLEARPSVDLDFTSDSCAVMVTWSGPGADVLAEDLCSIGGSCVEIAGDFAYCRVGMPWNNDMSDDVNDLYLDRVRCEVSLELENANVDWSEV